MSDDPKTTLEGVLKDFQKLEIADQHANGNPCSRRKAPTVKDTEEYLKKKLKTAWDDKNSLPTIITTLIGTLGILYRKGLLPQFGDNPKKTIEELCSHFLPDGSGLTPNDLSSVFNNKDLDKLWIYLGHAPETHTRFFYWSELSISFQWNEDRIIDYDLLGDIIKNFIDQTKWRGLLLDTYPDSSQQSLSNGGYDAYCEHLHALMRTAFHTTNFVLLDVIDIGAYAEKGLIAPISRYNEQVTYEASKRGACLERLSKIHDDSSIMVLPITINWHLPAFPESFEPTGDNIAGKVKALNDSLEYFRINQLVTSNMLGEVIKAWEQASIPRKKFICPDNKIRDSEIPIIPMQLASGAHAVYTLFAYTSNIDSDQKSLIEVDPAEDTEDKYILKVPEKRKLVERVKCFFKIAHCYAPMVSLCLDHFRAGQLREEYSYWFDPCLPVEAIYFQEATNEDHLPVYKCKPSIYNNAPNYLTCLGGYCIAMLHRNDNTRSEAEKAQDLAEEIKKHIKVGCKDKDNGLKVFEEDKIADVLPEHFSIRPSFADWRRLEELMSDTLRIHVFTLFMCRAGTEEGGSTPGDSREVKEFVDFTQIEIKGWAVNYLGSQEDWDDIVHAQYDTFKADAEIINALAKHWKDEGWKSEEPQAIEKFSQKLAESFVDSLYLKLESLCRREKWKFKQHGKTIS